MTVTRRGAMKRAGQAVAAGAVLPFLPSINPAQAQEDADAALLARVAQWHRAYEKRMEADLFSETHPKARDEYYARGHGPASGRFWAIQKELMEARPETLVGAVALLGCAERNADDIDRLRAGEQVPQGVFFVHASLLSKTVYAALRRLAGGAS